MPPEILQGIHDELIVAEDSFVVMDGEASLHSVKWEMVSFWGRTKKWEGGESL